MVSYFSNCRRHPIHSISICSIFMISTLCGVVLFTLLLVTMALFLASVPDGSTRTRGSRGRRRNSLIDTRYMRKCLSRAGYDESLLYSLKRGTRSEARSLQPFLPRCPGVNDVQNKSRWWWMPPQTTKSDMLVSSVVLFRSRKGACG